MTVPKLKMNLYQCRTCLIDVEIPDSTENKTCPQCGRDRDNLKRIDDGRENRIAPHIGTPKDTNLEART